MGSEQNTTFVHYCLAGMGQSSLFENTLGNLTILGSRLFSAKLYPRIKNQAVTNFLSLKM